MQVEKAHLRGESSKGQFSDEFAFKLEDYQGRIREGFFHKSTVKENFLEVSVLKEEEDRIYVVLPQNLLDGAHNIEVNRTHLIYGKLN